MHIISSHLAKSLVSYRDAPQDRPAFAVIGRSNVGKSSLINLLLNRKNLARVSGKPGKTQLINYFLINDGWYLVDLPGYGWAQASKQKRVAWEKMVRSYLTHTRVKKLFILLDSRHPLQKLDLAFINFAKKINLPYALVLTKQDKCKARAIEGHLQKLKDHLKTLSQELPTLFVTSSLKKQGYQALLEYIDLLLSSEE